MNAVSEAPPMKFKSFAVLRHQQELPSSSSSASADESNNSGAAAQISYRLVLPSAGGSKYAYIYNEDTIICCGGGAGDEEPDVFDLGSSSPGNEILGTGTGTGGSPLFFTAMYGLVSLVPNDAGAADQSR